jgi:hypothetical protein
VGLFAPALLFAVCLFAMHELDPRFAWLGTFTRWPWELWVIAACGGVATSGGVADFVFHRVYVTVGPEEHHSHKLALLTGGLPLFLLMAGASVLERPESLLLPIIVVALYCTVLICYDEFVFHRRRCTNLESAFHRLLVFGNGTAWLAWCHYCFVRPAGAV